MAEKLTSKLYGGKAEGKVILSGFVGTGIASWKTYAMLGPEYRKTAKWSKRHTSNSSDLTTVYTDNYISLNRQKLEVLPTAVLSKISSIMFKFKI